MNRKSKDKRECARLVRASQAGRREAFNELVRMYQELAMAVAVRILGNASEAEDTVQKGFVKAYLNIGSLKRVEKFEFWLLRIMANTAISQGRAKKLRKRRIESAQYLKRRQQPSAVGKQGNFELKEAIEKAMLKLSRKEAMAISLFGLDGFLHKEVADVMDCSVETSRWYVYRARKKLKAELKEYL